MSSWGEQLAELKALAASGTLPPGSSPWDALRRRHLTRLHAITGRSTILYASAWLSGVAEAGLVGITPEDVQGLMEVVRGLPGPNLDLILWLPGGSPEAAEYIVKYLRTKFTNIRALIPHAAMSAATMIACACDRIVMGKHSAIGPIDPQFALRTELGNMLVPAYAIREQFKLAQREIQANPAAIQSWLPLIRQFGPALLVQCEIAEKLGRTLVTDWLGKYMFHGDPRGAEKAAAVAEALSKHGELLTHSRFIDREQARAFGLSGIDNLEGTGDAGQEFQDGVLSVFHATAHTFSATSAAKIIESHAGKAFIKIRPQMQFMQLPVQPAPAPAPPQAPPTAPPAT